MRRAHVPSATLSLGELLSAVTKPLDLDGAERLVERMTGVPAAVVFASARGALAAAIDVLAPTAEVAVSAYTCVAVPNAVFSAGRKPLYIDVSRRALVMPATWPGNTLVVAQDTYGFLTDLPSTGPVIRDAAHRADLLDTEGADVVITSFEHSKWLSAGQGAVVAARSASVAADLRRARDSYPASGHRLRHSLVTFLTCAMGRLEYRGRPGLANQFRRLAYRLAPTRLAGQSPSEIAAGGVDPTLLGRPNGTVARLITTQLAKSTLVGAHRRRIVELYDEAAGLTRIAEPLVRYPMTVPDPDRFEADFARAAWDIHGRWFQSPLHAEDPTAFGYQLGCAPYAERLATCVVNLPTHSLVTEPDACQLIRLALDNGAVPLD